MLPRNILVVSLVVFLVTTSSTAPVEEKEREEVEVEAAEEGEEELSEEEEDDDDSRSQDQILGVGVQQATTVSRGLGISAAPGASSQGQDPGRSTSPSAAVGSNNGAAAGSQGGGGQGSSATSQIQAGGSPGPVGGVSGVSAGQVQTAGESPPADATSQSEPSGYDIPDPESNGNGQKLLNGAADNGHNTGVLETFVGEASHLDYTGIIDQSSHDFLIGLMGGVDPFGPDVHIDVTDHTALPSQLDPTVMSSDPVAGSDPAMSSSTLDLTPAHHTDLSIDQSGPDHTSLNSGSDQSSATSVSGSSHSAGQGGAAADSPSTANTGAHVDQPDRVADTNGNGRQTVLTDTNGGSRSPAADVNGATFDLTDPHPGFGVEVSHIAAVTDGVVSLNDLQTRGLESGLTAGGAESVTGLHIDLTASGLGLSHDVTGDPSAAVLLHTESPGHSSFTHTMNSVPGEYPQTDMVTMATDMSTDTVTADPPATVLDSSHPAVTEHTRMAGSATEQYNPSGQGPEGTENVELEDTC